MAKRKRVKTKSRFKTNFKKATKRDAERHEAARKSFGYLDIPSGIPVFNAEPGGRIKLDIIPYIVTDEKHPDRYDDEGIAVPGEIWYKRPFQIHRNIGVSKDAVVCSRSFGKKCPICDYKEKQLKEGVDWNDVKELKTSDRNLYVVIPKGSKDHEEVPHIWEISHFLFQNLLNTELEEDEDYAVFPDLEEGKTLRIRFDSKSIKDSKPFAEASRIDFADRKEGYDESILDEVPNLDEILQVLTYKELEAKFLELDEEDIADEDEEIIEDEDEFEDEEGEEEPAPKRTKKSAKKKKSKPEPEPEEEEEEWDKDEEEFEEEEIEDEDEFEEEKFEDEDEWEDDDWEEEEEEEPAPKSKSKPKPAKKRAIKRKKK